MPGHHHSRTVGDEELIIRDTLLMKAIKLSDNRNRIDNHTISHHIHSARVENARRNAL